MVSLGQSDSRLTGLIHSEPGYKLARDDVAARVSILFYLFSLCSFLGLIESQKINELALLARIKTKKKDEPTRDPSLSHGDYKHVESDLINSVRGR